MTIPMMPGWWDQNKEALQSLAQTATRVANPFMDAQMALMQSIRQNPQNMQTAINTAAMNPDMFAQMFGPRMAERIATMGTPDFETQSAIRARELANEDPSKVAPTVLNEAALAAARVTGGLQRRQQEATLEGTLASNQRLASTMWRESLSDNVLAAEAKAVDDAIASAGPEVLVLDPRGLAQQYFDSEDKNDPEMNARITALSQLRPEVYNLFVKSLEILNRKDDQRAQFQFQRTNQNEILEREVQRAARELHTEIPAISMQEAYRYYKLDPRQPASENTMRLIAASQNAEQRTQRMREFSSVMTRFGQLAALKSKGSAEAQQLRDGIGASLTSILGGLPISIVRDDPVLSSPTARFQIAGGREIDGTLLGQMINDPQVLFLVQASDATLQTEKDRAARNLAAARADNNQAEVRRFEAEGAKILAEMERRQDIARRAAPTSGRRSAR